MLSKKNKIILLIILLIIIVINLYLVSLPLTNLIGYEFSAINGIILPLLGGLFALIYQRDTKSFLISSKQGLLITSLFFVIPFVIGFINHWLFEICPFTEDIFFYLMIPIPALFINLFIVYWILSLEVKIHKTIFFLMYIIFILEPIVELYFNPQIYFYNPLIVFFPGNIYDEDISITSQMIGYRLINIFIYSLFLVVPFLVKKFALRKAFSIIPLVIVVCFIYFKPFLDYATEEKRLQESLKVKHETQHFTIYYSPGIEESEKKNISLQHEYHYMDIHNKYGLSVDDKIVSYIFSDGKEKRKLFGAENADVAKTWSNSIFLNVDNYFNSLRHELAHIFSAKFGVTPFKVAAWFNPALIEGFAMAIEDNYDDNTNHYLAWLAKQSGYSIPLESLFSGFTFFTKASSFSYIVSGSFTQFLIDKYGIEKFINIYRGEDFQKVYKKNISQLEEEYYSYLNEFNFRINKSLAKTYFGRQALIQKVCPRFTANRLRQAGELFMAKEYESALELFREVFSYSHSYPALVGITECLIKLGNASKAIDLMKSELKRYEKTAYHLNQILRIGDYSILVNNYDEAYYYYKIVEADIPIMLYDNAVKIRLNMLSDHKDKLKDFVHGGDSLRLNLTMNMLKDSTDYALIPTAINQFLKTEGDYKLFIENFVDRVSIESERAFYAVLSLGKFCLLKSDYERAYYFFDREIMYTSEERISKIKQDYLDLSEWLLKNSDSIKMKITMVK